MPGNRFRAILLLASALAVPSAMAKAQAPVAAQPSETADPLLESFRDPPASARPRVWWHWMNGNISKDGIAKDIAWMKRVGIGGMQTFDVNLQTPQVVDHRLVYMSPEWKDAFRFAASEADRQGLELAIASSPGWSETGGPWVKPEDGLKKLVWSETAVPAGKRFAGRLPAPPSATGPFQSLAPPMSIEEMISGHPAPAGPSYYGEVGVFAFPEANPLAVALPRVSDGMANTLSAAALVDADLAKGVVLARKAGAPPTLRLDYAQPRSVRTATLYVPDVVVPFAGAAFTASIEASTDGSAWTPSYDVDAGYGARHCQLPSRHRRLFSRRAQSPQA